MPKAESETKTRAPRAAKASKPAGEKKTRAPSAYALFVKEQMPIWKENNPEKKHTEAMKEIAALWADSDKNPNKGGKKEKAPAEKKKPGRPKKKAASEEEDEGDEE